MSKTHPIITTTRGKVIAVIFTILVLGTFGYLIKTGKIKSGAVGQTCKYLISYGVNQNGAYPDYIANNLSTIENLPNFPYNGVGIQTHGGTSPMYSVMEGTVSWTYDQLKPHYQSLFDLAASGTKPSKLKHNFLMVQLQNAGGFYDPGNATDKAARDAKWATVASNYANLAKIARDLNEAGFPIDGIFFDNEGPYGGNAYGNPPFYWVCGMAASGVGQTYSYSPTCNRNTNLATYQEQSRARGRQVMDAIKAAVGSSYYSKLKFMFMHSTDESCSYAPSLSNPSVVKNWNQYLSDLQGPFELGLAESAYQSDGLGVQVIDGGEESYGYKTLDIFSMSYNFRHNDESTYINPETGSRACPWIPTTDQTNWKDLLKTAFAMYNQNPPEIPGQTVATIGQSTKLALENSDNYVWFYVEGNTTTIGYPYANQIGQDWTDNIKWARDQVVNDPSCDSPGSSNVLNLSISLQGRTDFSTSNIVLKIYDSSGQLAYEKSDITIDANGNASITLPSNITVGTSYDFYLKPPYYLADYKASQTLTNPYTLTYATFRAGDFNNDNIVNSLDFSLLNGKWLQNDLLTDINKDGLVNSLDYAILNSNFGY